jgi:RNA polymerase sigma-70 factor (ECF subfamily)
LPQSPRFEFDRPYVDRLAAGDPEIERHFTGYFRPLLQLKLRSRLRSSALVDDATQETFLRVLTTLRQKGGLASAGSLGGFVSSVCNNVLFEIYRSESKLRRFVSDDQVDPIDSHATAESALVLEADQARVRAALDTLPEKDRSLLRWLFFEERNKDEICRTLGVDREYLRVLLHRAKARFRQAYADDARKTPAGLAATGETVGPPGAL